MDQLDRRCGTCQHWGDARGHLAGLRRCAVLTRLPFWCEQPEDAELVGEDDGTQCPSYVVKDEQAAGSSAVDAALRKQRQQMVRWLQSLRVRMDAGDMFTIQNLIDDIESRDFEKA